MTPIAGPIARDPRRNMPAMPGMKMDDMPGMQMDGMAMPGHEEHVQPTGAESMQKTSHPEIAPDANSVKLYPQDAMMESPMMAMDAAVDKPENAGLTAGWSGFMQGMMTFVRVLPPEKYDEVIARMKQAKRSNDPYSTILESA